MHLSETWHDRTFVEYFQLPTYRCREAESQGPWTSCYSISLPQFMTL